MPQVGFSANLGFLWRDLPLPDAIRAAARAGFDAVECHFPYQTPPEQVRMALRETGLPMLGINTSPGTTKGLAAQPDKMAEARSSIDAALDYAAAIDAQAVHVMAGTGQGPAARDALLENLGYAVSRAGKITVLIEALNNHDAPGYHLGTLAAARSVIEQVPDVKLMFDCYHVARTEGDVQAELLRHWPMVGHIQFAGVPDRGPPDRGTLDYEPIFAQVLARGWTRPLGAEYLPDGPTENGLSWMKTLKANDPKRSADTRKL